MIEDIKLHGYHNLNGPVLPENGSHLFHLVYIINGSGTIIADSDSLACGPGTLFFFPGMEILIPKSANYSSLSGLLLSFSCGGSELRSELSSLPCRLPSRPGQRELLMEILHECILKKKYHTDLCAFYLEALLLPLLVNIHRAESPEMFPLISAPVKSKSQGLLLEQICSYIENHLKDNLSLENLCQKFGLTPTQLRSLFHQSFSQSASLYVQERRLAHARELLCFSSHSITEIAEASGFSSIHYFSRAFKRKTGLIPTEYRKRAAELI